MEQTIVFEKYNRWREAEYVKQWNYCGFWNFRNLIFQQVASATHDQTKKKKTRQKSPRIRRSQIRLFKFNLFLFVRMFPAMYSYTENALGDLRNSDHIEASYNTDSKQTNSPRPAVAESQVETTTRGSLRQVFCLLFLFLFLA